MKAVFKNQTFQIVLLIFLGLLISRNIYNYLLTKDIIALVPVVVQIAVFILILTKSKHAKIAIKVWSIILIIGPGLIILGIILSLLGGDDLSIKIEKLAVNIIVLIIGLIIYNFNQKTVEVKRNDKEIE